MPLVALDGAIPQSNGSAAKSLMANEIDHIFEWDWPIRNRSQLESKHRPRPNPGGEPIDGRS